MTTEEVFFGSVGVKLGSVNGKSFAYKKSIYTEIITQEEKEKTYYRASPLHGDLVMNAIPAVDPTLNPDIKLEPLKDIFATPLMKNPEGKFNAIQSGRRSALIKVNDKWYRLKGCGNLYEGFPLGVVEESPKHKQILGCMFEYTCSREILITETVNKILEPLGFQAANQTIGWWEYEVGDAPFPNIKRCCYVSETVGNKRLGDNLLVGLERLLPYLIKFDKKALFESFPEIRRDENEIIPTAIVSFTGQMGEEQDFHAFPLEEHSPDNYPLDDKKWTSYWNENCQKFKQCLSNKSQLSSSHITHLYWRLGRETGTICKALWSHGISWGTYVDIIGHHCNGHVNNLVVCPPGKPNQPLLSPLDYDMAFSHESFTLTEEKWNEWVELEKNGMKMVLGGDHGINSGVVASSDLSPEYEILKIALRDTLLCAFNTAMNGETDPHPPNTYITEGINTLIKLALIVTDKETA